MGVARVTEDDGHCFAIDGSRAVKRAARTVLSVPECDWAFLHVTKRKDSHVDSDTE